MDRESRHFISKLRRLEGDATPGPWAKYGDSIEDRKKIPLVKMTMEHFKDRHAEFIIELRNALPRLIALIERQEQEIRRLQDGAAARPAAPAQKGPQILQ
jgi:hypothetical protein